MSFVNGLYSVPLEGLFICSKHGKPLLQLSIDGLKDNKILNLRRFDYRIPQSIGAIGSKAKTAVIVGTNVVSIDMIGDNIVRLSGPKSSGYGVN